MELFRFKVCFDPYFCNLERHYRILVGSMKSRYLYHLKYIIIIVYFEYHFCSPLSCNISCKKCALSTPEVENKKKTDTKSPKKVQSKNSAGQSPLKPNPLPKMAIPPVTNGNRMTSQSPAKIKLVPKSVPDVKKEAARSKSPDLMIMSVTKPAQPGLSPSKMKPQSNSMNGNTLPQPVLGNITQKTIIPSSSKSNLKVSNGGGGGAVVQRGAISKSPSVKQVTKTVSSVSPVNQSVNFGDYAKNMVSMSQPMSQPTLNQSIGNQSTNQVVNLISNPMVQSNMVSHGGHPDVASIIQSSKGLNYNFNQTRNMFQVNYW